MLNENDLFPQGHAIGEAFCNRKEERERLSRCFLTNEHTVIVAPRRYGKSSLIRQVLIDTKIPGKRIDLLPATNILFINKAIKSCFSELANQIAPKTKKAKESLIAFIKKLHPKLTFNILGQQLEISTLQSPEQSIIDMLVGLDAMATKTKKRVVICFDEFQQIGLLKNHHSIEASIRHAVERSKNITYLFSGSIRHLLSQMFNTKSRPLYHLCNLMELEKIKPDTYFPILLSRSKSRWKKNMPDDSVHEILNLTKCHPYYVNALCRQLWKIQKVPTMNIVQKSWLDYVETQKSWISDDVARLSPNQRNILAALAYMPVKAVYGNEFCNRVKIATSSITKSLSLLIKQDFVFSDKIDGKYRVLDPAVETYLQQIRMFDFVDM